jgi:PTH2 family peptidyl-tRNA hydrolase
MPINMLEGNWGPPEKFHYKQVIILRTDVKMSKGKLVVQGAHASTLAVLDARESSSLAHETWLEEWIKEGFPKIALKAKSEEDLKRAFEGAKKLGLPCALVFDFGLTEVPPKTVTAVAIGPAPIELVDRIGKQFRLL